MRIERRLGIRDVLQGAHRLPKAFPGHGEGREPKPRRDAVGLCAVFRGIGRLLSVAVSSLGLAHLGRPLRAGCLPLADILSYA
jgi:hypothetical protein